MDKKKFDPKDYIDVVSVRLVKDSVLSRPGVHIHTPKDAIKLCGEWISTWDRECVTVIYLKSDAQIAGMHIASIGSINQSIVSPADIIRCGLLCNAANMILLHNHPSGTIEPSREDIAVTDRMIKAGNLMGMELLDHIIVGNGNDKYFSFMEKTDMSIKFADPVPTDYRELKWGQEAAVAEVPPDNTTIKRSSRRHR